MLMLNLLHLHIICFRLRPFDRLHRFAKIYSIIYFVHLSMELQSANNLTNEWSQLTSASLDRQQTSS